MIPDSFHFYIENYINKFRCYNQTNFRITIPDLIRFDKQNEAVVIEMCDCLAKQGFEFVFKGESDVLGILPIECENLSNHEITYYHYQIQDIPSLSLLSSRTNIPVIGLVIMRVIAVVICNHKVLYKAIVLDLDDTLWKGTLSEEGVAKIKSRLSSPEGAPFLSFMRFISVLSKELGLFVAICSRNDANVLSRAFDELGEACFPIKDQIDCVIANENKKSENLMLIAKQLSILPESIVFIDDNQLVRDEVRIRIPGICVPEWDSHDELVSRIISSCLFERKDYSMKSQNRKREFRMMQVERSNNSLPTLPIKVYEDSDHSHAIDLYLKSNQFNFSQKNDGFGIDTHSLYFELFRGNGESLGICSALTYVDSDETITVLNWAISCRFFGIGLEEFVLLHLHRLADARALTISYRKSDMNQKVSDLLSQYPDLFSWEASQSMQYVLYTSDVLARLNSNTALTLN